MRYTREYLDLIAREEIKVCVKVQQQLDRMLSFEKKYIFKQEYVDTKIKIHETQSFLKPGFKLKLTLEQKVWYEAAFGFFYIDGNGNERILARENLWQISRGSGKTTLGATLALDGLIWDEYNDYNPNVYCLATSRDQASILFNKVGLLQKLNNRFDNVLHKSKGDVILNKLNDGRLEIKTSEYGTLDGLGGTRVIFDEVHAYTEDFIKVVTDGGYRKHLNPQTFFITTNGTVRDKVYDKQYDYASKVLKGEIEDDRLMAFIYELDSIEEIQDENCWVKAIPLLGKLIEKSVIRDDVKKSKDDPVKQAELLTKTFGMAVNSYHSYFTTEECTPVGFEDIFFGTDIYNKTNVVVGADFSDVNDLCSLAILIPKDDDVFYVKWLRFIPRASILKLPVKMQQQYYAWESQGYLIVHEKHYNDQEFIFDYFKDFMQERNLFPQILGYDQWNSRLFQEMFKSHYGIEPIKINQNAKTFSNPMKIIKNNLQANKILFDDPVASWNFANVVVKIDANNNIYANKKQANNKIDDFMAFADAYIAYTDNDDNKFLFNKQSELLSAYADWDL